MKRRWILLSLLLIVVFIVPVLAQDESGPSQVGLRPDAPQYALHGPYWVGYQEFPAETDFHPTTVALWYPALNPNGTEEAIIYRQFVAVLNGDATLQGRASENAAPEMKGGPYPLVIFVHGSSGLRFYQAYLTEHLASYGFAVMAIDYGDSAAITGSVDFDESMYTRPKDVTWQIDYAVGLTDAGELKGLIDTQRIAVIGHSYGAYTALMAGGVQLDLSGPTSACVLYADLTWPPETGEARSESQLCKDLARKLVEIADLKNAPDALWPSWGDSRVDAIVPLAPDMLSFGADSLKNTTIPTMIMVGSEDRVQFPNLPLYRPYLYENLSSTIKSMINFTNAGHQIFFSVCRDVSWGGFPEAFHWCSDPVWDLDRAHDLTNHFTTAFLLDVLKGDKDAHAALLAENVDFPGITYETTMQ